MSQRIHLAIMKKSWGLLEKILQGEKTIESRWYLRRVLPWNRIARNEIIYFKNSGEPVTVRAKVDKVIAFSDLTPLKVKEILLKYGQRDGLRVEEKKEFKKFFNLFKNKRYCLLIFLKEVEKNEKPFQINKKGFGAMSAWLTTEKLADLKKE